MLIQALPQLITPSSPQKPGAPFYWQARLARWFAIIRPADGRQSSSCRGDLPNDSVSRVGGGSKPHNRRAPGGFARDPRHFTPRGCALRCRSPVRSRYHQAGPAELIGRTARCAKQAGAGGNQRHATGRLQESQAECPSPAPSCYLKRRPEDRGAAERGSARNGRLPRPLVVMPVKHQVQPWFQALSGNPNTAAAARRDPIS